MRGHKLWFVGALAVVVGCGKVEDVKHQPDAPMLPIDSPVGGARCGDGHLDPGETCDDGANNGPTKACTAACVANVCGDGGIGPGEVCDDGANNGQMLGNCAPDCSAVIVAKHIVLSANTINGSLGGNPVAAADNLCPANHRAMFTSGTARRATTVANDVVNPLNWVVHPWTQYVTSAGLVIWQTDRVALLGVRNGAFTALANPITTASNTGALTGLAQDWTTLQQNNCNGWSTPTGSHNVGIAVSTNIGFINNGGLQTCDTVNAVYCVEQ